MKPYFREVLSFLQILRQGRLHPETRHLVVKGQAGLCNRLWYLLAAKSFAARWRLTLNVDWCDGLYAAPGENAFERLFELTPSPLPIESVYMNSLFPDYWNDDPTISFDRCRLRRQETTGRPISHYELIYPLWQTLIDQPAALTLICSGIRFGARELRIARAFADPRRLATDLKLSQHSRDFIAAELPSLHDYIGVHVRRTDSPRQVELERYYRKIPIDSRQIFLCTDAIEVQAAFKKRFGNRLIDISRTYPQTGNRLHHAGHDVALRDRMSLEAVRDLYGLAQCGLIVHGINSSFSQYAIEVLADPGCEVRVARPKGESWRRLRPAVDFCRRLKS